MFVRLRSSAVCDGLRAACVCASLMHEKETEKKVAIVSIEKEKFPPAPPPRAHVLNVCLCVCD